MGSDKTTKSGIILYTNGERYDGQVKFNQPNGFGSLYKLQIKKVYEGEFHNGLKHGKGILSLENGAFYEGFFNNDLFHGRGYLQTRDSKYEGEFKNGEFSGLGVKTDFNRGQAFEGEWDNGKRNGNINFYQMKLESSSVWKQDKKVEISEVIMSTETSGPAITLNYSNINKTPNEFKDFYKNIAKGGKDISDIGYDVSNKNFNDSPNKPNIPPQTVPGSNLNLNVRVKEDVKSGEKVKEEIFKKSEDLPVSRKEGEETRIKTEEKEHVKEEGQEGEPPHDKQCLIF